MDTLDRTAGMTATVHLQDDLDLLHAMLGDLEGQPSLFRPGPYWERIARNSVAEIRRCGLTGFRGASNLIGLSYADNLFLDNRHSLRHGGVRRLARKLTSTYPLSKIYDAQVKWTEFYATESLRLLQEVLSLKPRTHELLSRYRLPYTLLGECALKARIDGRDLSVHYLNLLDQHDHVASRVDFRKARAVFEIGGGFGVNVHLLLENYPNIRKVLYLDIPPNLYVGTQYLKAFYGEAVADYAVLRRRKSLAFASSDVLEVFCIAPWQIEQFTDSIDLFMNAHSFVEMPLAVVKNYADHVTALPRGRETAIALSSYDGYDLSTTLDPRDLPRQFAGREFELLERPQLLNSSRANMFFVSPGSLRR
jgi:putative sugar O-methyltransferase